LKGTAQTKLKGTFRTFRAGEFIMPKDRSKIPEMIAKLPPPRELIVLGKDGTSKKAIFLRRVFVPLNKDGKPLKRHESKES
jgi:hypothetical protein